MRKVSENVTKMDQKVTYIFPLYANRCGKRDQNHAKSDTLMHVKLTQYFPLYAEMG